jgi:hypothetical protein
VASNVYLSGGPCDGKTVSANQIKGGLVAYIACGGGFYTVDPNGKLHSGDVVFDYAGKTKPQPPAVGAIKAPKAHAGYADLQRSFNKHWHPALDTADRLNRAALRSLGRAHKVKR